ncbi:hypothetical protein MMC22_004103 [Lobaria immixta]|nr:hypothetical protein [Lobaria immixta]
MSFTFLTIILFLLKTVASLAAVDPNSDVINILAPDSSRNDESDNSMTSSFNDANNSPLLASIANPHPEDAINSPPMLPVDAKTFPDDRLLTNDVPASSIVNGGADGAGIANNQIPDGECPANEPTTRRRMRRGCVTFPMIQQSTTDVGRIRKPGKQKTAPGQPQPRPWNPDESLPTYEFPKPFRDFKMPTKVYWKCDTLKYEDFNIPMCDSGTGKPVGSPAYQVGPDIIWTFGGYYEHTATLLHAYPWMPTYGCVDPEITWCCGAVTITPPDRLLIPDFDHKADYTASPCVQYEKVAP